jgi:hypothetical protein
VIYSLKTNNSCATQRILNILFSWGIIGLIIYLLVNGSASYSQETPRYSELTEVLADCDALAASPEDRSRPAGVSGVVFNQIDGLRAEVACRRAVQEGPSLRVFFQLGRALDAERKDTEAVTTYRAAADQGYAAAQSNLGSMYETGRGVTRDQAQAVFWYRKAADQGFARAQSKLGVMYAHGRGVAQDDALAVFWYRKAAAQGASDAQSNLGSMYESGRGVGQDEAQAVYWYREAAQRGSREGQFNLGRMYENGRAGLARDEAQAVFWYRRAAEQEFSPAQNNLVV